MKKQFWLRLTGAVALGALSFSPALAQKSQDTLRIGAYQPIAIIDALWDPQPQSNLMDRVVFDSLVSFDYANRKVVPALAESWTQIDPLTYEFKLRKDVKFHNGQPMTADDVVYTVKYALDPEAKFRFKEQRYGPIAGAEKVDDYTVRLKSKVPFAPFLARLTTILPVYPSKHHAALPDKSAFGRAPIGTGPYKAMQVDPNRGVILEKNADFKWGSAGQPEAKIRKIVFAPVPDAQTQVARMMVGEQDMMYDVDKEVSEFLRANPALEISVRPSIQFTYLALDAAGRQPNSPFKDKRVREAVFRAIDRQAISNALLPKEIAAMPFQLGMCHPWHVGCATTTPPPAHDPELARKLLAEAGVSNLTFTIAAWGPSRAVAEAVTGQLRRVGVNASVESLTVNAFVGKRQQGQLQSFLVLWDNGGGTPDIESTAGFFYELGDRNYNGDKHLAELMEKGQSELDPVKREGIYRELFNKANEERYSMSIMPLPSVVAHTKDLKFPSNVTAKPEGFMFNFLEWK
jgi:peptide/nickel transport system substrate-binding protein